MFIDNPNNEKVSQIMRTNKEIEEAMKKLQEISGDQELMKLVDLRRKAILDENQLKYEATVLGREEGRKKGRKEEKIEVAKKAIENKVDIETIILITGLSKEEVLDIQHKMERKKENI